ncbi:MAG: hypothetical protein ACR2LG_03875 [Actinomycetota bacterium]
MDFEQLKQGITEIGELASGVPEPFREKCFEILLTQYLQEQTGGRPPLKRDRDPGSEELDPEPPGETEEVQQDIKESDLHVKVKKFLKGQELTVAHINDLFYKEGSNILPLYEDLKTTQLSESQIRIALLLALRKAIQTGDFVFHGEQVRKEAQQRKCYDAANFTAHFKNSSGLFEGFEKYDKKSPNIRLSTQGKKRLGDLIKQLQ